MKKRYLVELAVIFSLLSCSENGPLNSGKEYLELLPLKVGNYWIYQIGWKITGQHSIITAADTLKVMKQENGEFYLQSREQVVLPNGFYENREDGLYMNDKIQFKYPIKLNENCGRMFMGEKVDTAGNPASGYLLKNDFKYAKFDSCYYYFLPAFYPKAGINITGFVIFKPGIGLVGKDWVEIDEIKNSFYNDFCGISTYHIQK